MQVEIISDSWKLRLKLLRKDFKRHQNILKDIVEEHQAEQDEKEQEQNSEEENQDPQNSQNPQNPQEEENQYIESLINKICEIESYVSEIENLIAKTERFILHPETIRRISYLETEYYEMIVSEEDATKINQEIDWNERMREVLLELETVIDTMWDENKTEEEMKERIFESIKEFYMQEQSSRQMTNSIYNALTFERNERVTLSESQIGEMKKMKGVSGTCGICLCDFESDEEVLSLQPKCSHTYHPNCIIPWLTRSVRCPSCRIDLR